MSNAVEAQIHPQTLAPRSGREPNGARRPHCAPCWRTTSVFGAVQVLGRFSRFSYLFIVYAPDEFLKCEFDAGKKLHESRHGTERALVDSPWQLPGEFVVDKPGIVRLAYRYQYCEDWPNPLVLIAAIKEALWET